MAGSVFGIHFWPNDPLKIVSVWNIKRSAWLAKLENEIAGFLEEDGLGGVKFSRPKEFFDYAEKAYVKRGLIMPRKPKMDAYGLPGGEIFDFEMEQYPKEYHRIALLREFGEETNGLIAGSQQGKEFIYTCEPIVWPPVYTMDRNTRKLNYENHFFLVKEAFGKLGTDGVKEETNPPRILSVFDLVPAKYNNPIEPKEPPFPFYRKHAAGLKRSLENKIKAGDTKYKEALQYLESRFALSIDDLGLIKNGEHSKPEETIIISEKDAATLTDEELFFNQMAGVIRIKK